MNETLQTRLEALIEKSGKSHRAVSLAAGLSQDTIRKLLANPEQLPTTRTLNKLAKALGVKPEALLGAEPTAQTPAATQDAARDSILTPVATMQSVRDVPVLGTAAGNHLRGAFVMNSEPVDHVGRPPALTTTRDLYALFVEGTSMQPQYQPGDLIFVNPNKPAKRGDPVVVQTKNADDATIEATIGLFSRSTEKSIYIHKHNPGAEIEIPLRYVTAMHRVLTTNELFGI